MIRGKYNAPKRDTHVEKLKGSISRSRQKSQTEMLCSHCSTSKASEIIENLTIIIACKESVSVQRYTSRKPQDRKLRDITPLDETFPAFSTGDWCRRQWYSRKLTMRDIPPISKKKKNKNS